MTLKKLLVSTVLSISLCQNAFAEPVEIDKVVGIVNQGVILQSEVNSIVDRVKKQAQEQGQQLPKDETLRVQAMERLVSQALMMQMAERMGLQISDSQLDQTLANIAKEQGGTISDLRRTVEASGDSFQAYREEIRKEITTQQVTRANVDRRIYISEQEVDNLLKIMASQGQSAEEYDIGHILIDIPNDATADEITSAKTRADKVIELLNDGQEFKRIAISSSGGSKALWTPPQ